MRGLRPILTQSTTAAGKNVSGILILRKGFRALVIWSPTMTERRSQDVML